MTALDLRIVRPMRPVSTEAVEALPTFHAALSRLAAESKLQDKSIAIETDIDAGQLSRMFSGQAGIQPEKFFRLMDVCGSELPLMWLNHQRGYDIEAMRKRESELERQLRAERELRMAAENRLQTITEFVREARAA